MPQKKLGGGTFDNEKVRATRERLMKWDQVLGMTIAELADKYRMTPGDVRVALSDAEKSGVLEQIERGVFETLMPKALAVLERHLDEGQSLKAVELTMALFGAVKTTTKATTQFAVQMPASGGAVGIVALDQIRAERTIHASQQQRHDRGAEIDHPGGEDPKRIPGLGREH